MKVVDMHHIIFFHHQRFIPTEKLRTRVKWKVAVIEKSFMNNSWIFAGNCNRDSHIICKRAPDEMGVASLALIKSSDVIIIIII